MKPTKVTIDTTKWIAGTLCDEGEYCALGFLGKACGLTDEELGLGVAYSKIRDCVLSGEDPTDWVGRVYAQNDANPYAFPGRKALDTPEKREKLKQLFAEQGIELEFT